MSDKERKRSGGDQLSSADDDVNDAKAPKLQPLDSSIPTFQYNGGDLAITEEMMTAWREKGLFLVKNLFSAEEVAKIRSALEGKSILDRAWELADGHGRASRLLLWSHPGTDVTGMVARCEKLVNTSEKLLGGEVYHYHTKLMMKEARFGGRHLWHQDYGYWYKNGNLTPDMLTAFIPLDKCRKENGCLQVVPRSHQCGRIEHVMEAGQTMADLERVDHITKRFPVVYAECDPGDGLFFHCNVLHKSDENKSDMRRWAFLVAYNAAANDPVIPHHHPQYTPLHKVPNDSIMTCTNMDDYSGKDFLDPATDKTVQAISIRSTNFH